MKTDIIMYYLWMKSFKNLHNNFKNEEANICSPKSQNEDHVVYWSYLIYKAFVIFKYT